MKPEAQRIAIAEACGWKWAPSFNACRKFNDLVFPSKGLCRVWKDGYLGGAGLPDYLNDLNAMHDAEKTLTDDQLLFQNGCYRDWLLVVCSGRESINDCGYNDFQAWAPAQATAAQRAEAFLRTLGLWEE